MMVFWIGLNILATEALRTLLGTDGPAWAVLLASSGPLYVVAMPLSMLAFTRVPVIRTRQYPMKAGEFIQIFRHVHSGNVLGQYDWQYIVCRSH